LGNIPNWQSGKVPSGKVPSGKYLQESTFRKVPSGKYLQDWQSFKDCQSFSRFGKVPSGLAVLQGLAVLFKI
jgi:hypothetical protein